MPQKQVGVWERQSVAETPIERNFEDFYLRVHERGIAHAEQFLDYDDACDAVQAAAVRMWELWGELSLEQRGTGYFVLAVHNKVIDALRRQGRYVALAEATEPAAEIEPPRVDPATDELDLHDLVRDIVAAMTPRCREVWTLVMVEGLTYEQVAAQLNLGYPTVGRHMALAKNALREGLRRAGISISAFSARQMLPETTGGNSDD